MPTPATLELDFERNRQVLTVSALNREARLIIETGLGVVWVTGEISNFLRHSSGHMYWSLKDARAQVKCAMFKLANRSLRFTPENGQQVLWGLHYGMSAWRHGEEAMDPFHDEVGFLLWDKTNRQVMRNVVFGRGIAILAGSSAEPHDKVLRFDAKPGEPCYGILQNKYLLERAEIRDFKSDFTINDDGTFSYTSDLLLKLAATGEEMHHTDKNTLHRVKRFHPSAEAS